jgi:prephenate dehydrogenase
VRISVIGVGLIGGSFALAARERLGATVRGYDPAGLEAARRRGIVDEVASSAQEAAAEADLVLVAAPVAALPHAVAAALEAGEATVSDVGSVKRGLPEHPCFIGGHPLAGAETSGVAHARADLFDGATWYLTPSRVSEGVRYERLHRLIADVGAQPTAVDPRVHDRIMASVSHLPHVLANVLVSHAAETLAGEAVPATGPSFRDMTRVAGANSRVWADIYRANADAVVSAIDDAVERLRAAREVLASGDPAAWNDAAAADRRRLLESGLGGGLVHELRVAVPNRPGVVADVALALGRAGVNIADMALHPAPDRASGTIALWIAGEAAADRACELIDALGLPVARAWSP